jgi:hypothetical protein
MRGNCKIPRKKMAQRHTRKHTFLCQKHPFFISKPPIFISKTPQKHHFPPKNTHFPIKITSKPPKNAPQKPRNGIQRHAADVFRVTGKGHFLLPEADRIPVFEGFFIGQWGVLGCF